jgi:hypothetical protein
MRLRKILPPISLFLLVSTVALPESTAARAAEGSTFIIAASEGYGVEDCLAERSECGRVVADAWCEAHGHGASLSYGLADDVTGAIQDAATHATGAPYVISCSD